MENFSLISKYKKKINRLKSDDAKTFDLVVEIEQDSDSVYNKIDWKKKFGALKRVKLKHVFYLDNDDLEESRTKLKLAKTNRKFIYIKKHRIDKKISNCYSKKICKKSLLLCPVFETFGIGVNNRITNEEKLRMREKMIDQNMILDQFTYPIFMNEHGLSRFNKEESDFIEEKILSFQRTII